MRPPLLLLLALTAPVHAAPGAVQPGDAPRSAVLVDPLLPVVSLALRALELPALDLNLRGHHMVGDRLGWTAELDYTSLSGGYGVRTAHAGGRLGARLALRDRGLEDWSLTPFVLGGATFVTAPGYGGLARYGVLGTGGAVGRTWVWGPVALDVGIGLYASMNLGYRALSPATEGTEVDRGLGVRPLVDLGVGHAW